MKIQLCVETLKKANKIEIIIIYAFTKPKVANPLNLLVDAVLKINK